MSLTKGTLYFMCLKMGFDPILEQKIGSDPTNDIIISEGRSKDRRFTDRILRVQGIKYFDIHVDVS